MDLWSAIAATRDFYTTAMSLRPPSVMCCPGRIGFFDRTVSLQTSRVQTDKTADFCLSICLAPNSQIWRSRILHTPIRPLHLAFAGTGARWARLHPNRG
jgi:hypothetical protein